MNNYIMFNKLLKCESSLLRLFPCSDYFISGQFVEHNHVHPRMFSHRKYFRREFSLAFRHLRALKQHNKVFGMFLNRPDNFLLLCYRVERLPSAGQELKGY